LRRGKEQHFIIHIRSQRLMRPSFFATSFLMQLTTRSQFLHNSLFLSSIHSNRSFRLGLLSSRFCKTPNISSITSRDVRNRKEGGKNLPLRVASSSSWVSTDAPGRWTDLTTEPRIKTFLTELYKASQLIPSVPMASKKFALGYVRDEGT